MARKMKPGYKCLIKQIQMLKGGAALNYRQDYKGKTVLASGQGNQAYS